MEFIEGDGTQDLAALGAPAQTIVHAPSAADKVQQGTASNADLMAKAICLSLKLSSLGIRKKVASNAVQSDADEDMLHVSKDLIESKTFKEIKSLDGKIKAYIRTVWLPSPMFKSGIYLIPIASLEDIDNQLEQFKSERHELVQKFIVEYPALKEAAETKLNSLFNPLDYPEISRIQRAFNMDTRYVTFSTPGKLKEISMTIWQREQDKAAKDMNEAMEEIKMSLREYYRDFMDHLVDRMGSEDDGSRKTFHVSTVAKFQNFLDTFQQRNIVNDAELAKLVEDGKAILGGVEPKSLRKNETLRDHIKEKFEVIKQQLDTMLVDRPRRKLKIKEEADEIGGTVEPIVVLENSAQ
jgi:hypothetical protein